MDLYKKIQKNPQNVTPKQMIELLNEYGFKYKRTKGDHEMYKKPGYRTFPVPVSQDPLAMHIVKEAIRVIEEIREKEG